MISEILVRYFHFLFIIFLIAAVLRQHLILKGEVPRAVVKKAQKLDIGYAIAVIVVLITGFLQWMNGPKPAEFYSKNPVFMVKITLFLVVGLISIYPSIWMGKHKKGNPAEILSVPKGIVWSLRLELLLLILMPLLATIMAKGIGIPVVTD